MRITASDLQIVFGTRRIIDVPDFALSPGEVTIIIGPNGAGKSTLLRALAGDLTPWQGLVNYGDMPQKAELPGRIYNVWPVGCPGDGLAGFGCTWP